MGRDDDREAESQRIIGRVGAESEPTMAGRVKNHMAGRDVQDKDWAELWGTRIGRWLGLALLLYLIWWLIDFTASGG
jgi:hypothetical protein